MNKKSENIYSVEIDQKNAVYPAFFYSNTEMEKSFISWVNKYVSILDVSDK